MSAEASAWAWAQAKLPGGQKFLLVALANRADECGCTFKGRQGVAEDCCSSPETVTRNLASLEERGLVGRARRTRENGSRTTDWIVLAPNAEDRGQMRDARAEDDYPEAVAGLACESLGDNLQGDDLSPPRLQNAEALTNRGQTAARPEQLGMGLANGNGEGARRDSREHLPPNFPPELVPHARRVYGVLCEVAEQHGARRVWPQAVGRVVAAHPRHPLVASAEAMAAWAVDPPRPIKDVVGTYRTWLGRERPLQGVERLAEDGAPTAAPSGAGRTERQRRRAARAAT